MAGTLNRRDALYSVGIPCVIFFKLKSKCSACDNFMPIWRQLTNDPLFHGKVSFIVYSFGPDNVSGKYFHVAPEYKELIDGYGHVPVFIIHLPFDQEIIDLGHGPSERTFENMKETVVSALSTTKYKL
jgi:hypothetical protein